jgi:hypothetical protein
MNPSSVRRLGAHQTLSKARQCTVTAEHFHHIEQTWAGRAAGQRDSNRLCELTHLHALFLDETLKLLFPR